MTFWTIIRRSIVHHWRANLAVGAAVAIATAVIVGSLVVGESVKASLRSLALERLGDTTHTLSGASFFRTDLPETIRASLSQSTGKTHAAPMLRLTGQARRPNAAAVIPRVHVLGVTAAFFAHFTDQAKSTDTQSAIPEPAPGEAHLNQWLAELLDVKTGEVILVNLPANLHAPADSSFARRSRTETIQTVRVKVGRIIPAHSGGRFSLRADEHQPRNLYVNLAWLQTKIGHENKINLALFSTAAKTAQSDILTALAAAARPADFDLRITSAHKGVYYSLMSGAFALSAAQEKAAREILRETNCPTAATSVYLANAITPTGAAATRGGRSVPYSIIAGMAATEVTALSDVLPDAPDLKSGALPSMTISVWTAAETKLRVGDTADIYFYRSTRTGDVVEAVKSFRVRRIIPMRGAAIDRALTPPYPGMTDAKTMRDWNPPFPLHMQRITPADEHFWERYHAAPKAFIPLASVRDMWRVREVAPDAFRGGITSLRFVLQREKNIEPKKMLAQLHEKVGARLATNSALLGFRPVREAALNAAGGSTDFAVLFLALGFFILLAAAGLIGLLLRLSIVSRAATIGVLFATGFSRDKVRRLFLVDGLVVALPGVLFGVVLGLGYAKLLLGALGGEWSGAVSGVTLTLHPSGVSLASGGLIGFGVAVSSILWALRRLNRYTPKALVSGGITEPEADPATCANRTRPVLLGVVTLGIAIALTIISLMTDAISPVAGFMLSGCCLLLSVFGFLAAALREGRSTAPLLHPCALSLRAARRDPVRSLLTVGLLASTSFVTVVVGTNRSDLTLVDGRARTSGAGGYTLQVTTSLPIFADLGSVAGRESLALAKKLSAKMNAMTIIPMRETDGENAGCLNLNQPQVPRVIGVPKTFLTRGGFAFSKTITATDAPWELLDQPPGDAGIPTLIDARSAAYILKISVGDTLTIPGRGGAPVRLQLVGLLKNSIFAGALLIGEKNFLAAFGAEHGFSRFLIDTQTHPVDAVAKQLREGLAPFGADVLPTAQILADYARVQNTYLSAFQTLGGLGLLLGTLGVVAVLLRNVIERRRELALLRAIGFTRGKVARIVLWESAGLVLVGIVAGALSGLIATAAAWSDAGSDVDWLTLGGLLGLSLTVGVLACTLAAHWAMRGEVLKNLRAE